MDPMVFKLLPMTPAALWQQAFLTALAKTGCGTGGAAFAADEAVKEYLARYTLRDGPSGPLDDREKASR